VCAERNRSHLRTTRTTRRRLHPIRPEYVPATRSRIALPVPTPPCARSLPPRGAFRRELGRHREVGPDHRKGSAHHFWREEPSTAALPRAAVSVSPLRISSAGTCCTEATPVGFVHRLAFPNHSEFSNEGSELPVLGDKSVLLTAFSRHFPARPAKTWRFAAGPRLANQWSGSPGHFEIPYSQAPSGDKMRIAKFIAGAALVGAPLSIISAQSTAQPDSGSSHDGGKWIAGAGAAAGAALFLTFTGHGATSHSSFTPSNNPYNPPSDPGTPPASTTTPQPGSNPPVNNQPPDNVTPPDNNPQPPADTTTTQSPTPPDTGSVTPPQDNSFIPQTNGPHEELAGPYVPSTSTVPEPGSLALTATGIIGLLPLVRRRRK
jgi:hypothetical protein